MYLNNLKVKELQKFNKNYKVLKGVFIPQKKPINYAKNFGYQWRDFSKTQIDKFNKTNISIDFFKNITFSEHKSFKKKIVLEIGCGPGRFTEYLYKFSKKLVINDLSDAIFFNHFKNKKNVIAVQDDFNNLKKLKLRYDIIICRGVLQHTPDPLASIIQMKKLLKKNGSIYFDIYIPPKTGFLNSKYIWRNIIKILNISYDDLFKFLKKNCKTFLFYRRKINSVFHINLNFFWDYVFPIYDYKNILPLNNKQLEEWAIMDTLDGLLAKYDTPYSFNSIQRYLSKFSIKIKKYNKTFNCYKI